MIETLEERIRRLQADRIIIDAKSTFEAALRAKFKEAKGKK